VWSGAPSSGRAAALALCAAVLAAVLWPAGCLGPRPTLEGARALVQSFMADRLDGLVEEAGRALSSEGRADYGPDTGLVLDLASLGDVTDYYLSAETEQKAGLYTFTYRIHRVGQDIPYSMYWDEVLTVTGRRDAYTIDGAVEAPGQECFVRDDQAVYLRSGDQERRLFGMQDLPDEWVPPGMPADFALGIGKEGYVLLAFSPAGDRIAFVTWGTHGFLGVYAIAAGSVEGLDLHWEGVTVDVRWSPSGILLAAVVDAPTGNNGLYIYDVSARERLALGLEGHFPPDEFTLDRPRWSSATAVTFSVRAAEGASDKDGTWELDVGTAEVRKLAD